MHYYTVDDKTLNVQHQLQHHLYVTAVLAARPIGRSQEQAHTNLRIAAPTRSCS